MGGMEPGGFSILSASTLSNRGRQCHKGLTSTFISISLVLTVRVSHQRNSSRASQRSGSVASVDSALRITFESSAVPLFAYDDDEYSGLSRVSKEDRRERSISSDQVCDGSAEPPLPDEQ